MIKLIQIDSNGIISLVCKKNEKKMFVSTNKKLSCHVSEKEKKKKKILYLLYFVQQYLHF